MNWWTWRDVHATVIERIEARLIDLSATGCRLEASSALEVGAVGLIEIRDLETPLAKAARVCRTIERPGASARFVLQLEFLPLPLDWRAAAYAIACSSDHTLVDHALPNLGERSQSSPTKNAALGGVGTPEDCTNPPERREMRPTTRGRQS